MRFLTMDTKRNLAYDYGFITRNRCDYRIPVVDIQEPTLCLSRPLNSTQAAYSSLYKDVT